MKISKFGLLLLPPLALSLLACGGGDTTTTSKKDDVAPPASSNPTLTRAAATELVGSEVSALTQFSGAQSGDITTNEGVIDAFNVVAVSDVSLLAITETTFFCSSPDPQNVDTGNGSITMTTDDQDPAGRSTGDSVTTTFNQCVQFGSTMDGTTSNKINVLTGDPFGAGPWELDTTHSADITRTSAARTSTMTSTSSSASKSTDGVVIVRTTSGQGTRSVTDAAGVTSESSSQFSSESTVDLNLQTKTSSFDMSSTEGASSRTAKTTTPISGPLNGAPTAGIIEIAVSDPTAGVNRLVRVTMQSDGTALVEIDTDGDGVIDQTFTVPWFGFGGIGFGGGFGGGSPGFGGGGPGFGGGTGGGTAPPVSGGPPVASPGRLAPPTPGAPPISPVPPVGAPPAFGGGFTRPGV